MIGSIRGAPIKPATYYTGMYSMHKFWGKKAYNIVDFFIRKYTKPDDIVLDTFCGSGVIPIEAVRLGRRSIGIDLNPVAIFITRMTYLPIDLHAANMIFQELKKATKDTINQLYRVKCPYCGGEAIGTHFIWSKGKVKKIWFRCPLCSAKGKKTPIVDDLRFIEEANNQDIEYWHPKDKLIPNPRINVRRLTSIHELFTRRNLKALSIIYHEIEKIQDPTLKDFFKFIFTSGVHQASNMVFVIRRRGKTKGKVKETEEVGSWIAGYWVPEEHFEINAWHVFENRFKKVLKAKEDANRKVGHMVKEGRSVLDILKRDANIYVTVADAKNLSIIPDNSIDYVLTDPPHTDSVPYFELSVLWASWLKFNLDFENEIVISNSHIRRKEAKEYFASLERAIKEMFRVLKPGRFLTIIFNAVDIRSWASIQRIFDGLGFKFIECVPVPSSHPSVVQLSRNLTLKGDIYITFMKSVSDKLQRSSGELWSEKDLYSWMEELIREYRGITTEELLCELIAISFKKRLLLPPINVLRKAGYQYRIVNGRWYPK